MDMRSMMHRWGLAFVIAAMAPLTLLAQDTQSAQDEPAVNPALERLNDAIVFYTSFDHEDLVADLAEGKAKPLSTDGEVVLKPGKYGTALLAGAKGGGGLVRYSRIGHVDLTKPGAVAFWVSAQDWLDPSTVSERGYTVFFNVRAKEQGVFLIERMGFSAKRRESLLAGHFSFADRGNEFAGLAGTRDWKPGEWHLVVANWDDRSLEVSLDGGALKRKQFARPLESSDQSEEPRHAWMSIGGNDQETSLIDELMIFRRKLSQDEISTLWQEP